MLMLESLETKTESQVGVMDFLTSLAKLEISEENAPKATPFCGEFETVMQDLDVDDVNPKGEGVANVDINSIVANLEKKYQSSPPPLTYSRSPSYTSSGYASPAVLSPVHHNYSMYGSYTSAPISPASEGTPKHVNHYGYFSYPVPSGRPMSLPVTPMRRQSNFKPEIMVKAFEEHMPEGMDIEDGQKVFLGGLPRGLTPERLIIEIERQGFDVLNKPVIHARGYARCVVMESVARAKALIKKGKILIAGKKVDVRAFRKL